MTIGEVWYGLGAIALFACGVVHMLKYGAALVAVWGHEEFKKADVSERFWAVAKSFLFTLIGIALAWTGVIMGAGSWSQNVMGALLLAPALWGIWGTIRAIFRRNSSIRKWLRERPWYGVWRLVLAAAFITTFSVPGLWLLGVRL